MVTLKRLLILLILFFPLNVFVPKVKELAMSVKGKQNISFEEAIDAAFSNIGNKTGITKNPENQKQNKLDVDSPTLTLPLEGYSINLTLDKIKDFSEIKVGQCLVKLKACAFVEENLPKWRESSCNAGLISNSYQVIDLDPAQNSALTIYWHGSEYYHLYKDSQKELDFKWDLYMQWYSKEEKAKAWYQGNCGLVQEQVQRWDRQTQEKIAKANPPKEEDKEEEEVVEKKPLLKVGQCVALPSQCVFEEEKEEWEDCHPFSEVYRIKKIGKKSYLVEGWYGYQDDTMNLLHVDQTLKFWHLDEPQQNRNGFEIVSCQKMKKKYPKGNYSKIFQRTHGKDRSISSK